MRADGPGKLPGSVSRQVARMPLPKGTKYRNTKSGVRLAFRGGTVIEAKNTKTGAVHSSAEFAADRKRKSKRGK